MLHLPKWIFSRDENNLKKCIMYSGAISKGKTDSFDCDLDEYMRSYNYRRSLDMKK